MLTGIHFLLTYQCTYECDHCFVYCSPEAQGTFTLEQLNKIFDELPKIGTIEMIYFEGGEPFLYYQLMLKGIEIASSMGFKTGIVTNGYWSTSEEDAELWLKPLKELNVSDLSISNDQYHYDDVISNPAYFAYNASKKLGIPTDTICIEQPTVNSEKDDTQEKGKPIIGGNTRFRGRAVDKLTSDLPKRHWKEFTECTHEELIAPERVHIDAYGNVHICQGIIIGNAWITPLSEIVKNFNPYEHPVLKYLIKGGPALLAEKYGIECDESYVEECHLCYLTRLALLEKLPDHLSPKQVYGIN